MSLYHSPFKPTGTHGEKGPECSHGPDQLVLALWTGIKAHASNTSAAQRDTSAPVKGSVHEEMLLRTPGHTDTLYRDRGNCSAVLGMTLAQQLMGSLTQKIL